MIHEMVHLYCRENGIKETSRGGTYHNGKFKVEAEKRGLECFKYGQYGWNTKPSEMLVEYALSKDWNEIRIGRNTVFAGIRVAASGLSRTSGVTGGEKRPSSTRKLICPGCQQSVRATRKVNIICGDCFLPMVEVA